MRVAFGEFPAGQKGENPQILTPSAVRANAILSARRSMLGYPVCMDSTGSIRCVQPCSFEMGWKKLDSMFTR